METWFADGRLDPREQVTLRAVGRTPGPVGISLFDDDAVLSWRDMVILMLTISDNHTTDVLLRRVGVEAVNATAARLGLTGTVIESDLQTMLDSAGQDIGCTSWKDSVARAAGASADELARADEQLLASRALDPLRGSRTTPRDMVDLLRLIWSDQAGPAAACRRVRAVMARQLTRHRIASGFRRPVQVAAKCGSLVGVVRNEIGVISCPDGRRYAAAVFTRSRQGSDASNSHSASFAKGMRMSALGRQVRGDGRRGGDDGGACRAVSVGSALGWQGGGTRSAFFGQGAQDGTAGQGSHVDRTGGAGVATWQ
ncbi:serine hydrolase [Streptomyces sp. NPDC048312]|uniref:serine hydrolase n=1 Tax=Streptomyces sp. NPDC048312 TaxID=3155485 RepID=UPI0033EF6CFB